MEEIDELEASIHAEGYDVGLNETNAETPRGTHEIESSSCNNTLHIHPAEPCHIAFRRHLSFQHTLGRVNSHNLNPPLVSYFP